MSGYISYGIDLGTTNSCIAKFDNDVVRVFRNNDQMDVTPSVVRIEKTGRIIVGRRAYATRLENPENVACEFKRWMGQKDKATFTSSGKSLSPEQLSSEVLKALLEDARKQTGDKIESAVITVPAAFGQLQCEATARAASLAGLKDSPLLQEPIAAAIAYGISPGVSDQRWMVFDLGGGTLDIAVVSSKDGRLAVLDHRGNNLLGGKDIDRLIVEQLLLPQLEGEFDLPSEEIDPVGFRKLLQRLQLKAEEAKIDLSGADSVVVSLFDIGNDESGTPIETEITISGSQLESLCRPMFDRCIELCQETLEGARISDKKLDRILLVGGPTQMPLLRRMLGEHFAAPVDFTQDPMTVVAKGAAIYAASLEIANTHINEDCVIDTSHLKMELAYDQVSSDLQCPIEGKVETDQEGFEIKIDAEGGHWTSGWLKIENGYFVCTASLLEGKTCQFKFTARNQSGQAIEISPESIVVRHGLTIAAPPLPHSISAEIVLADGSSELDRIFQRGTSLPCQITKTYAASKTLRPSEKDSIAIKLWEGEVLHEPEANEWVGSLQISSDEIKRPLPEGSEIELTISINFSRLMSVEAYIPRIDTHFQRSVYVAQRDEQAFVELAKEIPECMEAFFDRIDSAEQRLLANDDVDEVEHAKLVKAAEQIRKRAEDLDIELAKKSDSTDPDHAKRLVQESRKLRADLLNFEAKVVDDGSRHTPSESDEKLDSLKGIVRDNGSAAEKNELELINQEIERAIRKNDKKAMARANEALHSLIGRVLMKQDWYWVFMFEDLQNSESFKNETMAKQLLQQGSQAIQKGDAQRLREIVIELIRLLPEDKAGVSREKAMFAGIRRI